MKRLFIYTLFIPVFLFSLDINITSNPTPPTAYEIGIYSKSFLKKGYKVEPKEARRVLRENQMLAEYYYENTGLSPFFVGNLKIETEKNVANMQIKKILDETDIDDKTLKSYYVSHEKEFKDFGNVTFTLYRFDNYDKALTFYNTQKESDKLKREHYVQEQNITKVDYNKQLSQIYRFYADYIKYENKEKNFMLPPLFFSNGYSVIYVNELIRGERLIPFAKVKKDIIRKLQSKIFKAKKKEILNAMASKK